MKTGVIAPEAPKAASNIEAAALALRAARKSRCAIPPVSASHGIDTIEAAYAVAELNTQHRLNQGRRVVGKKVGLTSRAVQQQMGVGQPDFGVLLDDMEYLDGDELIHDRLLQPKVEAEVAFVVGRQMNSERPTWGEFIGSLDCALPALEIVDSAIADWKINIVDTVADNASSGLYVLGHQPVAIGRLALSELGMQLLLDGRVASLGSGVACLGHPLRAAYWLACAMAARGQPLRAGEVVLSGALGPMAPLAAGCLVQAQIGELGSVGFRMI